MNLNKRDLEIIMLALMAQEKKLKKLVNEEREGRSMGLTGDQFHELYDYQQSLIERLMIEKTTKEGKDE